MNIYESALDIQKKILASLDDDEYCHSLEDKLLADFVENFDKESPESVLAARKIIRQIRELEFSRWCA